MPWLPNVHRERVSVAGVTQVDLLVLWRALAGRSRTQGSLHAGPTQVHTERGRWHKPLSGEECSALIRANETLDV